MSNSPIGRNGFSHRNSIGVLQNFDNCYQESESTCLGAQGRYSHCNFSSLQDVKSLLGNRRKGINMLDIPLWGRFCKEGRKDTPVQAIPKVILLTAMADQLRVRPPSIQYDRCSRKL